MGTNYYAKTWVHGIEFDLHVGKSSGGWKFLFAEYDNLKSKAEWFKFLERDCVEIYDEYHSPTSAAELLELVESKQKPGNRDYLTALNSEWRAPLPDRSKYERLDAEGYRFATSHPDDWS